MTLHYSLPDVPLLRLLAADPCLTAIGEKEARSACIAWKRELLRGAPVPQRFYCSPFIRTLRTLELTFEGILPTDLKPVILEVLPRASGPVLRVWLTCFRLRIAARGMAKALVTSVGHYPNYNLNSPMLSLRRGLKKKTFCGLRSAKMTKTWRGVPS